MRRESQLWIDLARVFRTDRLARWLMRNRRPELNQEQR